MNSNTTMVLAIINGVGNVLSLLSILGVAIFSILGFINGFSDWRKDYLMYSVVGAISFWVIARICKGVIRISEK